MRPWLWFVLTPVTTWVPFVAWGWRARSRAWLIAGAAYAAATVAALEINAAGGDEGTSSDVAAALLFAVWGLGALHALLGWRPRWAAVALLVAVSVVVKAYLRTH